MSSQNVTVPYFPKFPFPIPTNMDSDPNTSMIVDLLFLVQARKRMEGRLVYLTSNLKPQIHRYGLRLFG
jgi:hypothetical protein